MLTSTLEESSPPEGVNSPNLLQAFRRPYSGPSVFLISASDSFGGTSNITDGSACVRSGSSSFGESKACAKSSRGDRRFGIENRFSHNKEPRRTPLGALVKAHGSLCLLPRA